MTDNLNKFQYIDLLRGVAVLGIIAVHTQQQIPLLSPLLGYLFNYGQLGVQLFFVASAITLCMSMTQRKEETHVNFYIRRFFRIAPLYYFGIALYCFWRTAKEFYASGLLSIAQEYNVIAVLENVFFLHGFHPKNFNSVVPGGWSIAVEMWFYAIFPLLFLLQSRLTFKMFLKLSIVVMLITFIAQFFAIILIQPHLVKMGVIQSVQLNDEFGFIYCSIANQINVFLVGILAFKKLKCPDISRSTLLIAVLLCVISCYLLNTTELRTGFNGFFYPILSAIAFGIFALKLSTIRAFDNPLATCLIKIGRVSFSMYLLHFLFVDIMTIAYNKTLFKIILSSEVQLITLFSSLTAVTYFFAKYSYAILEKPAINYAKRFMH